MIKKGGQLGSEAPHSRNMHSTYLDVFLFEKTASAKHLWALVQNEYLGSI